MKRIPSVLIGALLVLGGCRSADDLVAAAAAAVVEDLLPRVPAGHRPLLASEWQIPTTDSTAPVPTAVLERLRAVSGLPLADATVVQSRDPDVVVLYLFRPRVVRSDSVLVGAGWLGLSGGDGGREWGAEYEYVVECRTECSLLREPVATRWN
jgi:hypothetical protein